MDLYLIYVAQKSRTWRWRKLALTSSRDKAQLHAIQGTNKRLVGLKSYGVVGLAISKPCVILGHSGRGT